MTPQFPAYKSLLERGREIALVDSASALLNWDEETYMPRAALAFRAEQLAFFSGWSHRRFTAPEVGEWIRACQDQSFPPESEEAANVREWRRLYERQTRLPTSLVEEFNRTTTLARDCWTAARQRSEFSLFRPHLEKVVELSRQMADHWGYAECRYDALLESYEPGARASALRQLFAALRPALVEVIGPATARSESIPADFLEGDYPIEAQQAFNREVAEKIGFDFEAGRIDATTHPFCSGLGPGDTRLTTRYHLRRFTDSFYSVLHETGHGLYEQGLKRENHGSPLGSAVSMGIHESQSRLWENHIGRSLEFWEHFHPVACRHLPPLGKLSPEAITRGVNRVSPSLIRTEADQVTYDLHILLRFDLELKLIEGELKAVDLPACWNEEFKKLLGLSVPDDTRGCLQDIHWSSGLFGYFPTYTLGNLNAAQLMRRATDELPGLRAGFRQGQFQPLLGWLRQQIHQHGQHYQPNDLMKRATGQPTQAEPHLACLKQKFLA